MFVDDNLLAGTLPYLKTAIKASYDAVFMLLGYPDEASHPSEIEIKKLRLSAQLLARS